MAKKKKTSFKRPVSRGRVISTTSNARRSLPLSVSPIKKIQPYTQDLRVWTPQKKPFVPLRTVYNRPVKIKLIDKVHTDRFGRKVRRRASQTKAIHAFRVPEEVAVCVRRKIRKEVLHAIRKAGKVGQRRPKRNFTSQISCRRG
jgi:hypothetical protein